MSEIPQRACAKKGSSKGVEQNIKNTHAQDTNGQDPPFAGRLKVLSPGGGERALMDKHGTLLH